MEKKYTGEIQDSKPNGIGTILIQIAKIILANGKMEKTAGLIYICKWNFKNGEWKEGQFLNANSLEKSKKKPREWSPLPGLHELD